MLRVGQIAVKRACATAVCRVFTVCGMHVVIGNGVAQTLCIYACFLGQFV